MALPSDPPVRTRCLAVMGEAMPAGWWDAEHKCFVVPSYGLADRLVSAIEAAGYQVAVGLEEF